MELIDINFLYKSGAVAKTIEDKDVFLLARPNPQRGDGYLLMLIEESDLISQIAANIPIPTPPKPAIQLLATLVGANINTTADQLITLPSTGKFVITDVLITNISGSMSNAASAQIWNGLGKTGVNVWMLNGPTIRNLVLPNDILCNSVGDQMIFTYPQSPYRSVGNKLYFSMQIAEGSPITADVYVYGYTLN